MKISVIVPVYNTERYLRRCLDSLLAQTFADFEILLIDDGSTDGSPAIEQEYAARDPRFRLIQKPNGGVASARNTGLAQAQGDFIAFVDSDDFVEPQFLEALYTTTAETGADIACCNFTRYFPKREMRLPHLLVKAPGVYSGPTMMKSLLHDIRTQSYLWNKLWRRSLFTENGIAFTLPHFEDTQIVLRLFYFARSIAVIDRTLYNYTQREGSIVHTYHPEVHNDFLAAVFDIRRFLEEQHAYAELRPHFRFFSGKSMFFLWGAVGIFHWREKCFRGIAGNLRRIAGYLNCCCGKRWNTETPAPQTVFRLPARRSVPTHRFRRKPKELPAE